MKEALFFHVDVAKGSQIDGIIHLEIPIILYFSIQPKAQVFSPLAPRLILVVPRKVERFVYDSRTPVRIFVHDGNTNPYGDADLYPFFHLILGTTPLPEVNACICHVYMRPRFWEKVCKYRIHLHPNISNRINVENSFRFLRISRLVLLIVDYLCRSNDLPSRSCRYCSNSENAQNISP